MGLINKLKNYERKSCREIVDEYAGIYRQASKEIGEGLSRGLNKVLNNPRIILIGGGLIALLAGGASLCGCENMSRREKESLFFGMMGTSTGYRANQLASQGDLERARSAAALSDLSNMASRHQSGMAAAEAGRSDVNITINNGQNQPREPPISQKDILVFICNSWMDYNNNNLMDMNEVQGRKNIFGGNEPIMIVGYLGNIQEGKLDVKILDLDKDSILYKDSIDVPVNHVKMYTYQPSQLKKGDYEAIFSLNGKTGSCKFEVKE